MRGIAGCSDQSISLDSPELLDLACAPRSQEVPPDQTADSFESAPPASGAFQAAKDLLGIAQPAPRPYFGPDRPPPPPRPGETIPTAALEGEAEVAAKAHNREVWLAYANDYRQYLEDYEQVYERCHSLEQLKANYPKPPERMGLLNPDDQDIENRLVSARYKHLATRTDRGLELLGKTPPMTLKAMLKGAVKLGIVKGQFDASADTQGNLKAKSDGGAQLGPVGAKAHFRNGDVAIAETVNLGPFSAEFGGPESKARLDIGVAGVEVSDSGQARLAVGLPGARGVAIYNPREAEFGGGVELGFKTKIAGVDTEVTLTPTVVLKGMSQDDARLITEGFLAPSE